jgi:hypothetical protein
MPKQYYGRTHDEWEAHSRQVIQRLYKYVLDETAKECLIEGEHVYRPAALGILIKLSGGICGYCVSEAVSISELQQIQHNIQAAVVQNCDHGVSAFFEANPKAAEELATMMTSTEGNA